MLTVYGQHHPYISRWNDKEINQQEENVMLLQNQCHMDQQSNMWLFDDIILMTSWWSDTVVPSISLISEWPLVSQMVRRGWYTGRPWKTSLGDTKVTWELVDLGVSVLVTRYLAYQGVSCDTRVLWPWYKLTTQAWNYIKPGTIVPGDTPRYTRFERMCLQTANWTQCSLWSVDTVCVMGPQGQGCCNNNTTMI